MASTFLAPALNASFDGGIAAAAQRAAEQKSQEILGDRQNATLKSPWERAVQKFNDNLTKDESKKLALDSCPKASLESFVQQVSNAKENATRKRSKVLDRIDAVVQRMNMFSGPIDTLSQTNQEFMFAWGTMKFLMQVVMSEKEIADKLAEAIADVVQIFGRCEQYTQLFSSHDRLLESIGVLYADVLNLLVRATRFYQKGGIKRFMTATVTPFEVKFAPIVAGIQKHGVVVENEASMAHAKEQQAENNLQRSFRDNIESQQVEQLSKEVKLWLQPSDSAGALRKLRAAQTTDTCKWLLGKEQYTAWVNATESRILWLYGIPGSGKSVLASYIISQLRFSSQNSNVPVVYFFCSGRDADRRASTHILRSLIFQLQVQSPGLSELVKEAYRDSTTRTAANFDELWLLFKSMITKTAVICVIDGLDECQEQDEDGNLERSAFAHHLVNLAKEQHSDLYFKILLTSRYEPDLQMAFHINAKLVHSIPISSTDVSKDIHTFISARIESSHQLSDLSEGMKTKIIDTLDSSASGMFIWARLMIEELERRDSDETSKEALMSLPRGLSDLYEQILHSLARNFDRNEGCRDLGCFILCFVVYGSRPLTLTELSEARCIKLDQSSLSLKRKPRSLVSLRKLIEAACAPLVEVQDDGLVQLAHHTTKEYLSENYKRLFEICNPPKTFGISDRNCLDFQSILTQVCLSYLSLEQFETPLLGIHRRFKLKATSDIRESHPFLEYAASNWLFHLSCSDSPPYSIIHRFVQRAQVVTWIEAAITLQGGVEKLATNIQFLPTLATVARGSTLDSDCRAVTKWFEALQKVIFDWGGTLNQTPSEIHFLDVLRSTTRLVQSKAERLQKVTILEDPTNAKPNVRPVAEGASFVICHPHVYVFSASMFISSPFLNRYHWLSMQHMGTLSPPRIDGIMTRVVEIQLSPSERFISAVLVGSPNISVAVWSVSNEGFDILPWAKKNGIIGSLSVELKAFSFSHRPSFEGPGWRRSARHTAFSKDGKRIWTPAGAFDLSTGEVSPVPPCCNDEEVANATWSVYGERIACIRAKKSLEIYENDGRLIAAFYTEHIASSMIVDFSRSGRYVLLLEPKKWQHFIFDVHQQSYSTVPRPTFAADENRFGLEIADYGENWTILAHSFSLCERYFSFLIDHLNHYQPVVLAVWDRLAGKFVYAQIWSPGAAILPSHMQFDGSRSETLHLLVNSGNQSLMGGTYGFVQLDLADKTTFSSLRETNKANARCRYDVCLNADGGKVQQKILYESRPSADVPYEESVDMISWDLAKALPTVGCRFQVPRDREGWKDGYSQSNGAYGDWYVLSKDSSLFIIGARLYSMSDKSGTPTLLRTFDPTPVFKQLLRTPMKTEEDDQGDKRELEELLDLCFWTFFSPDGCLLCFYASDEYIVVFDVPSGEVSWIHRLEGKHSSNYWASKPVFHPTRPMMAWVEQFGKDREDFNSLKHCGAYLVDLSAPNNTPMRLEGLNIDCRSDLIFSSCGSFLYGGIIGRDDYNDDERKIKFFKIDLSTKKCIAYLRAISPIKGPSYCGSPNPAHCTIILKDDEVHFLITVEYKVMLAKIDFDGTVKWKMIASLPGPPTSADATALSGWNSVGKGHRLDIVLAAQNFAYPTVINTWDENPDVWDEVCKVKHDESL